MTAAKMHETIPVETDKRHCFGYGHFTRCRTRA